MICRLALEDGCVFAGTSFGATGTQFGEVVFNTSMTGYQEIFTDPSYCGQIVTMTFPLIGNYGINDDDFESRRPSLSGFVAKELPARPSNHRSTAALEAFCADHGVIGLAGIDTRALTRRIRTHGALRGVISTEISDEVELVSLAAESPPIVGANLVDRVAVPETRQWTERLPAKASRPETDNLCRIVAIDCGIKHNILRHLVEAGGSVTVVPADTDAARLRDLAPDAIVVGNGPGDPAAVTQTIEALRSLAGKTPMLGVCLGHQMLALALGARTYKLKFGHHGANLPVMNHPAQRVEITSQNHGFAVDADSLAQCGGKVTHVNLNDRSLEGFVHEDRQIAAIQFHPEASPGPHDSSYVFGSFVKLVRAGQPISPETLFAAVVDLERLLMRSRFRGPSRRVKCLGGELAEPRLR